MAGTIGQAISPGPQKNFGRKKNCQKNFGRKKLSPEALLKLRRPNSFYRVPGVNTGYPGLGGQDPTRVPGPH
eukprot:1455223-Rhodomonas_salina.1